MISRFNGYLLFQFPFYLISFKRLVISFKRYYRSFKSDICRFDILFSCFNFYSINIRKEMSLPGFRKNIVTNLFFVKMAGNMEVYPYGLYYNSLLCKSVLMSFLT